MKVLHITWIDSSCSAGWQELNDLDDELVEIHTVGFLIDSNPERYVMALSYDPECDSANGVMVIPTKCIQEVVVLCQMTI